MNGTRSLRAREGEPRRDLTMIVLILHIAPFCNAKYMLFGPLVQMPPQKMLWGVMLLSYRMEYRLVQACAPPESGNHVTVSQGSIT